MLLILREEIICAIILLFLIFYYSVNKVKDRDMRFLRVASAGLLHVLLDMATVVTVNRLDTVPQILNDFLHICFYIASILFIQQFYNYVISLCMPHKYVRRLKWAGYSLLLLFVAALFLFPMEYVEGKNTNYSYGMLTFLGYGLFAVYCTICMALLILRRGKLDKRVRHSLIPMIIAMFAAVMLQAMVPELLMTGAGITFVCIGMFAALDNPDKDFRDQALWDFNTGLKNRNCYERDLAKHQNRNRTVGILVSDLNYLKTVNDRHGHEAGDRLIAAAADVLRENLKTANDIYRLGGDEFAAVYLSPNEQAVAAEIRNVQAACMNRKGLPVPLSIAIGYSAGTGDIQAIFRRADRGMYDHKADMKRENPALFR